MGARQVGPAALLLVSLAACSGSEPFVAPTTLAECWGSDYRGGGSGDTDSMWTMAYSGEPRPLGSSGTIHLFVPDDRRGRITIEAPTGVEVDRVSIVVGDGTDLPFPDLQATVTGRVDGELRISYTYGSGGGNSGVGIEVDGGGWSFENPFS